MATGVAIFLVFTINILCICDSKGQFSTSLRPEKKLGMAYAAVHDCLDETLLDNLLAYDILKTHPEMAILTL